MPNPSGWKQRILLSHGSEFDWLSQDFHTSAIYAGAAKVKLQPHEGLNWLDVQDIILTWTARNAGFGWELRVG